VSFAAGLTLVVIVAALGLMMGGRAGPDVVLVGAVVLLTAAGVLEPEEAFAGFGNTGLLTVAALFIVAAGLRETGAVQILTSRLLGRPSTERRALIRLVVPVMFSSAFLNNTTIVATLMPAVNDWARRIGVAPGRFLMPLSFASILGGVCTLIGTSTNLVVAGMVADLADSRSDLHVIGMFEITPLGVLVAAAGGLLLVVLGPVLLPVRGTLLDRNDNPRQYVMEVLVPERSRLAGRSIEDSGLRGLPGAYLMEVVRGDEVIAAIDPQHTLAEGDRLVFVGDVDAMVDLHRLPGLAAAPDQVFKLRGDRSERHIVKAVVSPRNPLVGVSIRAGQFRSRYHAVVIGVARSGERVPGRIGDIVLQSGDVLLLEAHPDFVVQYRRSEDFYMVSALNDAAPPRSDRAPVAMLVLAALMIAVTTNLFSTVTAAFLAAGAMIFTGCCTMNEARRSLDLTVLVAIGAAFGLGEAMASSGLADALAHAAITAGADDPVLGLIVVYVLTALLTELVTNNAAAVLAVPVAVTLADQLGAHPMGFVMAVMVAASAAFNTPIGYQTNLMVFNAGGYRPLDYPRLGLPLSIVVAVVTVATIPWLWPL
jgi:di/tricarboxylate transporter